MKYLKLKALIFVCIAISSIQNVKAQKQVFSESDIIQIYWGETKYNILTQYLNLSDGDVKRFTPIYNKYAAEHQKLGAERIQLVKTYIQKIENLTETEASDMMNALLKNNKAIDKLQLKYFNIVSKKVSPTIGAKFIQLELYIQSVVRAAVQDEIPFVDQLQHSKKK